MEVTTLVLLISGMTQVLKIAFNLPQRLKPLLSVFIGLILAFSFRQGFSLEVIITTGILAGLSSSGLYDVAKISVLGKK